MVKQWAPDGILLIGDAAHCATPIGAVGVSLSCSTAVVAAETITHALQLDDVSAARLSHVLREPEIRTIHTLQKRIENIMVDNPLIRKISPIAIQLIANSPIFKKIQKNMLLMPTELPVDRKFTF
jgi:2-polyprenyl-6-methoxyphenol hydroxylase-like FAD-dependent oxidoreductase